MWPRQVSTAPLCCSPSGHNMIDRDFFLINHSAFSFNLHHRDSLCLSWKKLINRQQIGSCNKAAVVWFPPNGPKEPVIWNTASHFGSTYVGQLIKSLIETNNIALDTVSARLCSHLSAFCISAICISLQRFYMDLINGFCSICVLSAFCRAWVNLTRLFAKTEQGNRSHRYC